MTRSSGRARVLRGGVANVEGGLVAEVDDACPAADGLEPDFGAIAHRTELARAPAVAAHVERAVSKITTCVRHGLQKASDSLSGMGSGRRLRVHVWQRTRRRLDEMPIAVLDGR